MKKIGVYITSVLLIILQVTLTPYFKFFNLNYGLVMCSVIVVASVFDSKTALINAIICGVVFDTFASVHYGLYLAVFLISALLTVFLSDFMYRGNLGTTVVITLILTFLSEFILYYIFMATKGMDYHSFALTRIILPQAVINSFVSVIIFVLYKGIYKKLKLDRQW